MTPLDEEHLTMAIKFYRDLIAVVNAKIDALAVKMGVDPDKDIVIVPVKIAGKGELPKWMMGSTQRDIKLIQGARRAQPRSKADVRRN